MKLWQISYWRKNHHLEIFLRKGFLQGNHDTDDGVFTLPICCLFRCCLWCDFFDNAPDKDLFDGAGKYFYNATDKDFYDGASAAWAFQ